MYIKCMKLYKVIGLDARRTLISDEHSWVIQFFNQTTVRFKEIKPKTHLNALLFKICYTWNISKSMLINIYCGSTTKNYFHKGI